MKADLRVAVRELGWRLFVRNLHAQYRQSFLGLFWGLAPPLATTILWTYLHAFEIIRVNETSTPYPVFVLSGTLLWQVFADALRNPLRQLSTSAYLLSKISFPTEALLVAGLAQVALDFCIRVFLLVPIMLWFQVPLPITMPLAVIGVGALALFGTSLGLLLTPMGLLYRDVQRILDMGVLFWFFITPVIYPASDTMLTRLNPVSPLLQTARGLLVAGEFVHPVLFLTVLLFSVLLTIISWVIYRVALPHVVERMSP